MVIRLLKYFLWEKISVIYADATPWIEIYEKLQKEINEDEMFPQLDLIFSHTVPRFFQNSTKRFKSLQTFLNRTKTRSKGMKSILS